jgi:hypothetical protein
MYGGRDESIKIKIFNFIDTGGDGDVSIFWGTCGIACNKFCDGVKPDSGKCNA